MYFPYLRGRQNELIAIRELVEAKRLSDRIIPIIEPVKVSSTLVKTLTVFNKADKKIVYIVNPVVGSYLSDLEVLKNEKIRDNINAVISLETKKKVESRSLILGMILCSDSSSMQHYRSKYDSSYSWLAVCTEVDTLPNYTDVFDEGEADYNLFPDDSSFRRRMRKNKNKVMLANRFKKLDRNTDYLGVENVFSEDHIIYEEDNYFGFSDYSIVGDDYSETDLLLMQLRYILFTLKKLKKSKY